MCWVSWERCNSVLQSLAVLWHTLLRLGYLGWLPQQRISVCNERFLISFYSFYSLSSSCSNAVGSSYIE